MELVFDIDGTICNLVEYSDYNTAIPDNVVIDEINRLYDSGNKIKMFTARGSRSGIDHTKLTEDQLNAWGVKYHELIMNKKPYADLFIDDRAIHIDEWRSKIKGPRAVVAGAFDVIHPGYIRMFNDAKRSCSNLTVALHIDPSVENNKPSPVLSVEEREEILLAIKNVDSVIRYETEKDLYEILASGDYDIRILGSDYKDREYTGKMLPIDILWINRDHGYSTTLLKKKIVENNENK